MFKMYMFEFIVISDNIQKICFSAQTDVVLHLSL